MRFLSVLSCGLAVNVLTALAIPLLDVRADGIPQSTYNDLERYAKYSSAVYQWLCLKPLGNTLVDQFSIAGSQGFVARDNGRKEIIVAFRGSLDPVDVVVDLQIILKPLSLTGVQDVGSASVHSGFSFAYKVVESTVLKLVKAQVAAYPSYTIVVTGHSLGGAVASLGAISIKAALPNTNMKLYTYGQPRTGNAAFASLVESRIGTANIFRAVHTNDGVPTILFKALGYRHFGTEYWNFRDPANAASVRKCTGGDDPTCSDSIPSLFITPAHLSYFGQLMALNPLLCI